VRGQTADKLLRRRRLRRHPPVTTRGPGAATSMAAGVPPPGDSGHGDRGLVAGLDSRRCATQNPAVYDAVMVSAGALFEDCPDWASSPIGARGGTGSSLLVRALARLSGVVKP